MIDRAASISLRKRHGIVAALIITTLTLSAFWEVRHNDFVNYDDNVFIYDNPWVKSGVSIPGIRWAFTNTYGSNWHPLTWLSHMTDCHLYGLNPRGHHLGNLGIHLLSSLLLFAALYNMTGSYFPSLATAVLFAVHPLHVESVAWAAERKDVLCAFFWMLTMLAYHHYTKKPGIRRYIPVATAFCLGLLAKPMIVTLPFVLLLLDYWPLRRFPVSSSGYNDGRSNAASGSRSVVPIISTGFEQLWPVIRDKIPFIVLSAIVSIITYYAQDTAGAVMTLETLSIFERFGNALVSYCQYLWKMVYPINLIVLYPLADRHLSIARVVFAGCVLLGITFVAIRNARRRPQLIVGWLWYVGTLLPVIGIIQVGIQSFADRYTYIPLVGIFIMIGWSLPPLHRTQRRVRMLLLVMSAALSIVLVAITRRQVSHWKNSKSLFTHALRFSTNSHIAHNNLGIALSLEGKHTEAVKHFREAVKIKPDYTAGRRHLGTLLASLGDTTAGIRHLETAVALDPEYTNARYDLGIVHGHSGNIDVARQHLSRVMTDRPNHPQAAFQLGKLLVDHGQFAEAIPFLESAIRITRNHAAAYSQLGKAMQRTGQIENAIHSYQEALDISPNLIDAHENLAHLLAGKKMYDRAIFHYREGLRIVPDRITCLNGLAWLLATRENRSSEDTNQAVKVAERAATVTGNTNFAILDTLAAAYAANGQYQPAAEYAANALALAQSSAAKDAVIAELRDRLASYRAETQQRRHPYEKQ